MFRWFDGEISPHFEDGHDDEDEDDLVADFGVSSVERFAAPCPLCEFFPLYLERKESCRRMSARCTHFSLRVRNVG